MGLFDQLNRLVGQLTGEKTAECRECEYRDSASAFEIPDGDGFSTGRLKKVCPECGSERVTFVFGGDNE